ncbi:MAG: glycosyltransferase family 39 protein [Planctomycetota bacterium]|jgi:hypothetical protein
MQESDAFSGGALERAAVWRKIVPIILVTFGVKCLAAWVFPFTGDEAYLTTWGRDVAWGYYDHPPLIGWLLHVVLYLGQSPVLLRSVSILSGTVVGVGIYLLLRPYDERKAYLAFLLFMFSPGVMAFFILSTEAPLLLFSFLSAALLFRAESKQSYTCYLLSGVFLGLAFLSKYFAVLLGFSYLVYLLFFGAKDARRVKGFLLLFLAALALAAQNIVWNYQTGWPNLMHNFFNRIKPDTNPVANLLALAAITLYVLTPPVLCFLFKNRTRILRDLPRHKFRIFAVLSLVAVCVFVVVSFKKGVRPHWFLYFMPFIYVTVALLLDDSQLIRSIRFCIIFSLVQTSVVIGLVFLGRFGPVERLKEPLSEGDYASLVTHLSPQEALAPLKEYKDRFVLATSSFSIAGVLEYYGQDRIIVFGKGSRHGRHDDMRTDFKQLDGRDILLLFHAGKYEPEYELCFERTESKHFELNGADYNLLLGYNFKYEQYRRTYLPIVVRRYYQIPDWLPGEGSFFHRKYEFSSDK